jgi:hypothetical protein
MLTEGPESNNLFPELPLKAERQSELRWVKDELVFSEEVSSSP